MGEHRAIPTSKTNTRVRRSVTTGCARWSAQHPGRAIIVWLLFVMFAIGLSAFAQPRLATDAELTVGQAGVAAATADQAGLTAPVTENVLITDRSGAQQLQQGQAAAAALTAQLSSLPEVASVSSGTPSTDGNALLVVVTMSGDPNTAEDRVGPIQDVVNTVGAAYSDLRFEEAGEASVDAEFHEWLAKDIQKATLLSVPVTLVILLVAFGAIVMAGVPVILALFSVASALGLWAVASQFVPDPGMVVHVIVLMGMAVGVDYSLFYLKRFREEFAAGRSKVDAVSVAAATSGHSVVVSGTAVALSMAGLYLAQDVMFSAMATGAILVVLIAMVSSLTVLPAALVLLSRWVDRPRVPVLWRLTNRPSSGRILAGAVSATLRRPILAAVLALGILTALALPALGMKLKSTQISDFPRTLSTMQTYDRVTTAFPERATFDTVVATVPAGSAVALQQAFTDLGNRTSGADGSGRFGGVTDVRFDAAGTTGMLTLATPHPSDHPDAKASVTELRTTLVQQTVGSIPGSTWAVGGDVASNMDYTANLGDKLPLVGGFVLLLMFVIMLIAFRSVVVACITVLLNLLSCAAAFGILTLVFQHTWAESLLDFTSTGHIVAWVPMLLFVVLCGLSLDYHVFVLTRIQEDVREGMTPRHAVQAGLVRTAGVVTSAAVVMIAVFAIFGTLSFIELKQIGVGLAAAIALDATVIRLIALPALLVIFGDRAWPKARLPQPASKSSAPGQQLVSVAAHD